MLTHQFSSQIPFLISYYLHFISFSFTLYLVNGMQFYIYNEIRERFGDRLWIDVVSKADLLSQSSGAYTAEEYYKATGPEGALHVSIKTNQGVDEVL